MEDDALDRVTLAEDAEGLTLDLTTLEDEWAECALPEPDAVEDARPELEVKWPEVDDALDLLMLPEDATEGLTLDLVLDDDGAEEEPLCSMDESIPIRIVTEHSKIFKLTTGAVRSRLACRLAAS